MPRRPIITGFDGDHLPELAQDRERPDEELARAESVGIDVDGLEGHCRDVLKIRRRGGPRVTIGGFGPGSRGFSGVWKIDKRRGRLVRIGK